MDKENKVMDFRIILHENLQNVSDQSATYQADTTPDYTLTFVIGTCVLALFLLLGVVASAYLCLTLKKGTLLWVTDSNRQLNKDRSDEHNEREESSVSTKAARRTSANQETTQV
ncbi:uncharacterized protein LOC126746896 [Anthonomus grandis grandis]|uniref:uncharacterized protein LOC126746896 n=1 Tax=Anthonomus grandis grandis TaxID=2921223 RepID=UPI002166A915|nr:uncharacterized protein LOC126746896 [Anthonomus grandis grandis]